MNAINILNHVKNITETEALNYLENELIKQNGFISLGFLNQHGFNLLIKSPFIQELFFDLDLLLRDGIGIKLANKVYKIENSENLNGTDLIPTIIDKTHSDLNDYYVFGTESPWLENGSKSLLGNQTEAHLLDGFQQIDNYLDYLKNHVNSEKNSIIILAMGMPKQEELAFKIKQEIKGNGIIICGGAIIDFKAGKIKRAPKLIQKLSLEWSYRLVKEPKRLFKRYVIGIPIFFYNLAKYK